MAGITCVQVPLAQGTSATNQTKLLQTELKKLGYYTGTVDGDFGSYTKKAVIAYQKAKGLYQDGIAGSITCTKLGIWCAANSAATPAASTTDSTAAVADTSTMQGKIISGTGKSFTTFTQFYNIVKNNCAYAYYFNGQYNATNALNMLIKDINGSATGLNCVDYAQLGAKLAKEMGYSAVVYGIYCTGDKINHAIFKISGKEFSSATWIDLAAAAKSSYSIGNHWCSGSLTKEPSWIPYE